MDFNREHPVIVVTNESKVVSRDQLERAIDAVQKQVDEHFAPSWGVKAALGYDMDPIGCMRIIIKDTSDEPGALGYHFQDGYPVTYVFAKDDIQYAGEFTSTLSHEVLEMLADPGVNLYAFGSYKPKVGSRRKALFPYEVCDPVEGCLYEIDGIKVSDFVYPEWFEAQHKRGAMNMDYLGVLDAPFKLASGGYADVIDGKKTVTLWGREANRAKIRHRKAVRIGA